MVYAMHVPKFELPGRDQLEIATSLTSTKCQMMRSPLNIKTGVSS
jgi:hypothetical protein